MQSTRTCWSAAVVAVLLCLVAAASAQAARTITGIASEGGNYVWGSVGDGYASEMAGYTRARYIVPWDVALRPGSDDWNRMDGWYRSRKAQGKQLLVSFNHSENRCIELVAANPSIRDCVPLPPSVSDYAAAIAAFRTTWRGVPEFTAWNEPNHSAFGDGITSGVWSRDHFQMNPVNDQAPLAADYFTALVAECAIDRGEGRCTPVAGDFSDGDGSMGTYPTTYKRRLADRGTPAPLWAVHAHAAVNSNATQWIDDFFRSIAPPSSTWITEVGVKVCDRTLSWVPDATQEANAHALNALLARYDPARTYYYMVAATTNSSSCRSGGLWDSGLLNDNGSPRPALRILFPELDGMWWDMRNEYTTGPGQRQVLFGGRGIPVAGDWNGDGTDEPGTYNPTTAEWTLLKHGPSGAYYDRFNYGYAGVIPVAGDWNGDGIDSPGVFDPTTATWYLRDAHSSGTASYPAFGFGYVGVVPLVGDWNNDGIDSIGVYDPATARWFLRDSNTTGVSNIDFYYGNPGDRPVVGDWNTDGQDSPGVFQPATAVWALSNVSGGPAATAFNFGSAYERRVLVGDWNGDGYDSPAVIR